MLARLPNIPRDRSLCRHRFLSAGARPVGKSPDEMLQFRVDDEVHHFERHHSDQALGSQHEGLSQIAPIFEVDLNSEEARDGHSASVGALNALREEMHRARAAEDWHAYLDAAKRQLDLLNGSPMSHLEVARANGILHMA
jgi:hypothetical protein